MRTGKTFSGKTSLRRAAAEEADEAGTAKADEAAADTKDLRITAANSTSLKRTGRSPEFLRRRKNKA